MHVTHVTLLLRYVTLLFRYSVTAPSSSTHCRDKSGLFALLPVQHRPGWGVEGEGNGNFWPSFQSIYGSEVRANIYGETEWFFINPSRQPTMYLSNS